MIVLSSSMVLLDVDGLPEGTPWIGWHNLVSVTRISSTTEDDDFPATNLANPATDSLWKASTNTSDEYVEVQVDYEDSIDYLAVARHNFGTAAIICSVEGRITGDSPDVWTELVQETLLPDDSPVIFRFEPTPLTQIRLRLQPGTELPQAAVMYVGKLLVCERSITVDTDHVPLKFGRQRTLINGMSESGNYLGSIELREWRQSVAEFEHFTPTWYRSHLDPFIAARVPFFFAWSPVEYPLEAGYAWITNDPVPNTSPITRRVSVTLEMQGIA